MLSHFSLGSVCLLVSDNPLVLLCLFMLHFAYASLANFPSFFLNLQMSFSDASSSESWDYLCYDYNHDSIARKVTLVSRPEGASCRSSPARWSPVSEILAALDRDESTAGSTLVSSSDEEEEEVRPVIRVRSNIFGSESDGESEEGEGRSAMDYTKVYYDPSCGGEEEEGRISPIIFSDDEGEDRFMVTSVTLRRLPPSSVTTEESDDDDVTFLKEVEVVDLD